MSLCLGCGCPLTPMSHQGRKKLWCSGACRVRATRMPAKPTRRECQVCGLEFARTGNGTKCPGCRGKVRRTCEVCAAPIVVLGGGPASRRACPGACEQQLRSRAGKATAIKRGQTGDGRRSGYKAKSRRRALRCALSWDGITDQEILDRDRWRCHICRERISQKYRHPHPRSASIDHLIPLSQGGDDTAVNKQAAHLGCNVRRSNRGGGEQLALLSGLGEPRREVELVEGRPRTRREPPLPRRRSTPIYYYECRYCGQLGVAPKRGHRRAVCPDTDCQRLRLETNRRRFYGQDRPPSEADRAA